MPLAPTASTQASTSREMPTDSQPAVVFTYVRPITLSIGSYLYIGSLYAGSYSTGSLPIGQLIYIGTCGGVDVGDASNSLPIRRENNFFHRTPIYKLPIYKLIYR